MDWNLDLAPYARAQSRVIAHQSWANSLASMYGAPIYLVGSQLYSSAPGDVDVRCLIDRADLFALFGDDCDQPGVWPPGKLARAREELKQSRRATRTWRNVWGARIDFQFQITLFNDDGSPIEETAVMARGPVLRMDTLPWSFFEAGRGTP